MSDDIAAQTAKDKLEKAIKEYFAEVDPDSFIHAYAVVAHKESVAAYQQGGSTVGYLTPTDQPWPVTVGMLTIALDFAKSGSM